MRNSSNFWAFLGYFSVVHPVVIFFWSWLYMLLLGAVHSFIPIIPALGFWQTVIFGIFLTMTGGALKSTSINTVSKSN